MVAGFKAEVKNQSLKIYLITDYRGGFYSSIRNIENMYSMDVELLCRYFAEQDCELIVMSFADVDFREQNYSGKWVLYQSSEDPGLCYKSYIEDIVLGMHLQGARLIPPFNMLRAHHNKVFMEILRDLSPLKQLKTIRTKCYGIFEEFAQADTSYPCVMKPASGACSKGVVLVNNKADKTKYGKKLSRVRYFLPDLKERIKRIYRRGYVPRSLHRGKFIVQNLISGLSGDYKVLVYDDKYYVLHRQTRKNDFRASGSGLFRWPEETPTELLDFAREIFLSFDVPFVSLDIACNGDNYHLLEFQFLSYGTLTLEKSSHYYSKSADSWIRIDGESILENEVVRSVVEFVQSQSAKNPI